MSDNPLTYLCPLCHFKSPISASLLGKHWNCPACRQRVVVLVPGQTAPKPKSIPDGEGKVRVTRPVGSMQDPLRDYRIAINGVEAGRVRVGRSVEFPVASGRHTISIFGCSPVEFDLWPGTVKVFEVSRKAKNPVEFMRSIPEIVFLGADHLELREIS